MSNIPQTTKQRPILAVKTLNGERVFKTFSKRSWDRIPPSVVGTDSDVVERQGWKQIDPNALKEPKEAKDAGADNAEKSPKTTAKKSTSKKTDA